MTTFTNESNSFVKWPMFSGNSGQDPSIVAHPTIRFCWNFIVI